jgi:hypothetical protein
MCEISLAPSGNFRLTIPSSAGGSHSVEIPLTMDGVRLLKKTLEARVKEVRPTIGMIASPTAADIHKFLQSQADERRERIAKRAAIADDILELAGIELEL